MGARPGFPEGAGAVLIIRKMPVKEKVLLWLFVIEQAVAVSFFCDLVLVIDARAFYGTVAFLVPAPQAAGTVGSPELLFVPYKPPDNRYSGGLLRG